MGENQSLQGNLKVYSNIIKAITASSRSWQRSQVGFRALVTVVGPRGGGEAVLEMVRAYLLQHGLQIVG
jgi:hypothetical protein